MTARKDPPCRSVQATNEEESALFFENCAFLWGIVWTEKQQTSAGGFGGGNRLAAYRKCLHFFILGQACQCRMVWPLLLNEFTWKGILRLRIVSVKLGGRYISQRVCISVFPLWGGTPL